MTDEDEELTALREAADRLDKAEDAVKSVRGELAEEIRAAYRKGYKVPRLEAETGYSRGHVYDILGNLPRSHIDARRARRKAAGRGTS